MKILQINAVYNKSSTGRTAWEMQEVLLEKGYDCRIAATDVDKTDCHLYQIGNQADRKLHALFSRISGLQGYYSHRPTKKLLQYIDEYRPDIVLLRNLHGNYIHLPWLLQYLAKKDIATVAVLHDCWFYTGKCVHYHYSKCDGWQRNCGKCPELKSGNKSWFFDRSGKMIGDKKRLFGQIPRLAFVGVSNWITQEISKSTIGQNALLCERIYNWIDFDKFYLEDKEGQLNSVVPSNKKVILGVSGEWSEAKRLSHFLRIAQKLEEDKIIVLVGTIDPKQMLPSNVICVGKLDSIDALRSYYNRAEVFLNLSGAESFGKVAAEALACGTPVVCYHSTANGEIVGEGCGYVVQENDTDAVLHAINEIICNGKKMYSAKCVQYARQQFDKHTNIAQYEKIFNRLIEGKSGSFPDVDLTK